MAQAGEIPAFNKHLVSYRLLEKTISEAWPVVRERCTQAERISSDVVRVTV